MGYLRPDSECTGGVQGYSAVDECWQVAVIRNQGIGIWWVSLVETLVTLWQHTHIYTHTGHFIRYTLLVPGRTPFCLHSLWHRFNKVLETFLIDFGPYWHDSIMQLLQICRLHIHDVNLPFPPHPKCALLDWDLVTVEDICVTCSRNQSEMIWCLWHCALSCWKKPSEDGTL